MTHVTNDGSARSATAGSGAPEEVTPARPAVAPRALQLLFVGVVLYVCFGKGFAYAGLPPTWGLPPLYVGELLLGLAVMALLRVDWRLPRSGAALVTALLGGTALAQLAMDRTVGDDPWQESLRGLAPIYYAVFAFSVYALLRRTELRFGRAETMALADAAVRRVGPFATVALALVATLLVWPQGWIPSWPRSGVAMLSVRSTDVAVSLAMVFPVVQALGRRGLGPRSWRFLIALWAVAAILVVFRSRGAMLGLGAGLIAQRPRPDRVLRVVYVIGIVLLLLYVTGFSARVASREVSFDAAVSSVGSLALSDDGETKGDGYTGTKQWRLNLWGDIWSDVSGDRMLLHGHGWGDNLALRYGAVSADEVANESRVLRSPHGMFFSLSGRAGVLVALAFVAIPLMTLIRSVRTSRRSGGQVAVEAARAGVAAGIVVSLTSVHLEGPQGAIVFWSLIGFLWWAGARVADRTGAA